ncbi:amidohydrolase family protein [Paraglaciecola sp. 2405UD69-4]|uniref:amidohydrolase family protein n=1 Tax=Paraglaciecola sp. 2405UD69-4 TaxID=3391836 RepID=UPI0039C97815
MRNKLSLLVTKLAITLTFILIGSTGYAKESNDKSWQNLYEESSFQVYRRQSPIGEETYKIASDNEKIIVSSLQGENERGRKVGVVTELYLTNTLKPLFYSSKIVRGNQNQSLFIMNTDSNSVTYTEKNFDSVTVKKPDIFFPVHSNISAAAEMMLYHYYLQNGKPKTIQTFPRGEVSITFSKQDEVIVNGQKEILDRYVTTGINWGGRTVWLNQKGDLVALVKANTQIREMVRKGYEDALQVFIDGNVEEQLKQLATYTKNTKTEAAPLTALVGADIITGLKEDIMKDMTLIYQGKNIVEIGKRTEVNIPKNAKTINLDGKTLIPGLWDMHAHSNQVQWAPAYLAAGVTTIRDNGNEVEFATAFRDAVAGGLVGPDILLAGMTDGAGKKGNGVIRARSPEEARSVARMYHSKGYKQIKIYSSMEPDIAKILIDEAKKLGMSITGHVPTKMPSIRAGIEMGMNHLSHHSIFLKILYPDREPSSLKSLYLVDNAFTQEDLASATKFLLEHNVALEPTVALDVARTMEWGEKIETLEPDAYRIAYELWEGKRLRTGFSPEDTEKGIKNYKTAMDVIGHFHRAGIPIIAGTDNVVPVFSLWLELESFHKLAKMTPLDTIRSATIVPAQLMEMDKLTGTLEVGKEADIAILDKNPLDNIENLRSVTAVITNGNYYQSKPLFEAADFNPNRNPISN